MVLAEVKVVPLRKSSDLYQLGDLDLTRNLKFL